MYGYIDNKNTKSEMEIVQNSSKKLRLKNSEGFGDISDGKGDKQKYTKKR